MALQPKEKKLLKILAGVVVVGGFVLYQGSRPQEIVAVEADPEKVAELEAKKASSNTKSSRSTGSASLGGGSSGGASSAKTLTVSTVSISEFESHSSPESCWVLIDGKVYDITDFVKNSPNPNEIAPFCGTFAFEEGYLEEISLAKDSIIKKSSLKGTIG